MPCPLRSFKSSACWLDVGAAVLVAIKLGGLQIARAANNTTKARGREREQNANYYGLSAPSQSIQNSWRDNCYRRVKKRVLHVVIATRKSLLL